MENGIELNGNFQKETGKIFDRQKHVQVCKTAET